MKKIASFVPFVFAVVFLVACGDDGNDFVSRPSDDSSSSECEDCDDASSSSGKETVANSSSSRKDKSSSSAKSSSSSAKSGSSIIGATPCKTDSTDTCEYGELLDDRDGKTYRTVKIGSQIWMAENLNYETADSYCDKDSAIYCSKFGRLYTWAAAMDSVGAWSESGKDCGYGTTCSATGTIRGVCPSGWHLPSNDEWEALIVAVDPSIMRYTTQNNAGPMLRSSSGWGMNIYTGVVGAGTDDYSFSALPADYKSRGGCYGGDGCSARFLSSTEYSDIGAYNMGLDYDHVYAHMVALDKSGLHSVRCLKDENAATRSSSSSIKQSSSSSIKSSSSESVSSPEVIVPPCKTETEDNCEYGELTDARDGQTYRTVKIGTQTWMAENLNFESYKSFCYENSAKYCSKYGRLYTWAAAMDSAGTWSSSGKGCGFTVRCTPTGIIRGVCPEGWHLPDSKEWGALMVAVGGKSIAGTMLKSTSDWIYTGDNGIDAYSFSALPAGSMVEASSFYEEGKNVYYWSSTELNAGFADNVSLDGENGAYGPSDSSVIVEFQNDSLYYDEVYKLYKETGINVFNKNMQGYSVRCLKDSE